MSFEGTSSVRISTCVFSENKADRGGALYLYNTRAAIIDNSQFLYNNAYIANERTKSVFGTEISRTNSGSTTSVLQLIDTEFLGNVPHYSYVSAVPGLVRGAGGAIQLVGANNTIVSRNTFTYNSAAFGAAVNIAQSKNISVTNNYFSYNQASLYGSAILSVYGVDMRFRTNQFVSNICKVMNCRVVNDLFQVDAIAVRYLISREGFYLVLPILELLGLLAMIISGFLMLPVLLIRRVCLTNGRKNNAKSGGSTFTNSRIAKFLDVFVDWYMSATGVSFADEIPWVWKVLQAVIILSTLCISLIRTFSFYPWKPLFCT